MPIVLDSTKIGSVGEYVKSNTGESADISVASPIFTIYDLQELCIPASVESVSMHITSYQAGIKSIRFEGMTTEIDDTRCRGDEWGSITLYAKEGSAAESFTKEHGMKLELI